MAFDSRTTKIVIDGDNSGAKKAIDETVKGIGAAQSKVSSLSGGISESMRGITASINPLYLVGGAAVGAVAGLVALTSKAIATADEITKMAQRIGTTTEYLSTFRYAASLSGLTLNQVETSFTRLSKSMADISTGAGSAVKNTFDQLGISVKNADGTLKNNQEIVYEVADAFKGMEDGTLKTAAAVNIFGKSGAAMIPLLNGGSVAIKNMQNEAKKMGLEISTNTAKRAEQFNDNITKMKFGLEGVGIAIASALLPSLASASDSISVFVTNGTTLDTLIGGITMAFKVAATAVYGFIGGMIVAGQVIGTVGAAIVALTIGGPGKAMQIIRKGFADIKETSLATGDAISALWNPTSDFEDQLKKIKETQAFDEQSKQAQKLAAEWEKVKQSLRSDVIKNSGNEFFEAVNRINNKMNELNAKFGNRKEIEEWGFSMLNAAAKFEEQVFRTIESAGRLTGLLQTPATILPIDNNAINDSYQRMMDKSTEVTAGQVANMVLLNGTASEIFSNMNEAASSFYTATGQKSKALFNVQKGLSVALALINTYEGFTKALAQGGVFGAISGATVLAAGLAKVAAIASVQPGTTGGSSGGGGGGAAARLPAAPNNFNNNSQPRQQTQTINLIFQGGNYFDADKLGRELEPSIRRAFSDTKSISN